MKKRLLGRLKGCWFILTKRNFILIHEIKEFEKNGVKMRKAAVLRRTDYSPESDFLSMKMGIFICFPETKIPQ